MTLKEYLNKFNIRVEEFALRSGISFVSLYKYFSGERKPHQSRAERIERETGGRVTVMELRGKDARIKPKQ